MDQYEKAKTLDELPKVEVKHYKGELTPATTRMTVEAMSLMRGYPVTHKLLVSNRKCNYGGIRYYINCTRCNKRCTTLYVYNEQLCCNACIKLPYETQLLKPEQRLLKRLATIRQRLDWNDGVNHGPKPRGIWKSTYDKLVNEHDRIIEQLHQTGYWTR